MEGAFHSEKTTKKGEGLQRGNFRIFKEKDFRVGGKENLQNAM